MKSIYSFARRAHLNLLFSSLLFSSLLFSVPCSAQMMPYGVVIAADSAFVPAGNGLSIHTGLNEFLTQYGATDYVQAYPFAKSYEASHCFEITLSDPSDYEDLKNDLVSSGYFSEVLMIESVPVDCSNPVTINDPGIAMTEGYYIDQANLPCAWSITKGSPDIVIAIPDIYFDYTHSDLDNKFVSISLSCNPGLSSASHGFGGAGAAAAIPDNNFCVAGSGYNSSLAGYCVGSTPSSGNPGPGIIQAYLDGHKIISVSFTGSGVSTPMLQEMVDNGVTIVHSLRGDTWNPSKYIPGIISVGMTDINRNYEPQPGGGGWETGVDIYAPGRNIVRLQANNSCSVGYGGTSFATPLVAGIIALMLDVNPNLCPPEIEEIIKLTNQGLPNNYQNYQTPPTVMTAGIVDAEAAVLEAQARYLNSIQTISSPTTWSTDRKIQQLIIEPGGVLTINPGVVVEFASNATVVVKRGAKLDVNGATLTRNICSGTDWPGIIVEGNSNLAQPNAFSTPGTNQAGIVLVRNGAKVEWARTAITTDYYGAWTDQKWGGLVHCENSTFINNRRAVAFMRYNNFDNKSKFINCTIDAGDFPVNLTTNQTVGVTIWDTDGISFQQCRFKNMLLGGIQSHNGSISVMNGNVFENNGWGIKALSTYPYGAFLEVGQFGVSPNYFLENNIHIQTNASAFGIGAQIYNNEFFDSENGAIWLVGPSGYDVTGNAIFQSQPSLLLNNGGVICERTEALGFTLDNFISNNTIDADFGILAIGENRHMQFLCNTFNTAIDFTLQNVPSISVAGAIRNFQGSNSEAAGNCFSSNPSSIDIATSGQTESFRYFFLLNAPCEEPVNPGNYTKTGVFLDGCGEGFGFGVTDQSYTLQDYQDLKSQLSMQGSGSSAAPNYTFDSLQQIKNTVMHGLIRSYVENDNYAAAYQLLSLEQTVNAELIRYGLQRKEGDYNAALNTLLALPDSVVEMTTFKQVQAINMQSMVQSANYQVNPADSLYLEQVAAGSSSSRMYAQAILELQFGRTFEQYVELDKEKLEIRSAQEHTEAAPTLNLSTGVRIFPNPAANTLFVESLRVQIQNIQVFSTLGHSVYHYRAEEAQSQFEIPVHNWNGGVYILQLLDETGQLISTERIVVNH